MPPGAKTMVVGFNHNIKYRGQIYHVQTEDSGSDAPRVTTHVFLGGNIVASKRTSYADVLGASNLVEVVRTLMEEQHKEMLRNLVNGVYDPGPARATAEPRAAPPAPAAAPPPPPAAAAPPAPVPAAPRSPPAAARPPAPAPPRVDPPPPAAATREPLFGEDLISERSLDEVILAYLAGERGGRKP
jgi:hypothetical protein